MLWCFNLHARCKCAAVAAGAAVVFFAVMLILDVVVLQLSRGMQLWVSYVECTHVRMQNHAIPSIEIVDSWGCACAYGQTFLAVETLAFHKGLIFQYKIQKGLHLRAYSIHFHLWCKCIGIMNDFTIDLCSFAHTSSFRLH